jgi:hypothetical protein
MINKNFVKTLNIISNRLNDTQIKWAIIGSANIALQGIDITPKDIDIIVELGDLENIKDIFHKYEISDIEETEVGVNKPTWKMKLNINNVQVEFSGQENNGEYVKRLLNDKIRIINIENIKLPCLLLEEEALIYKETEREDKAKTIRRFL